MPTLLPTHTPRPSCTVLPACSPAGTFASSTGQSHCTPCDAGDYQPLAGKTTCLNCPPDSYAHFPGSAACISCFFGQPVVVAGPGGLTELKLEQPSAGVVVASTSATATLSSPSCAFNPFTAACNSTLSRTIAIETDQTCGVWLYVLADTGCSSADNLTHFDG